MSNYTAIGITAGIALAFAVIFGSFSGFVWMALFLALGGVIGAHFDGRLDLPSLLSGNRSNKG